MERVTAAEEFDTGIRIALTAWEDVMQPDEGDEEMGMVKGKGKKERRVHGRYVIGVMRGKAMEGVERRRECSMGLQAVHLEVLSR